MPNLSMGSWIKMLVCALDEVANGFCEFLNDFIYLPNAWD